MLSVLLAALLFGLVHPGSKLLMADGMSLLAFCICYVLIRLLVQLPLAVRSGAWRIRGGTQLALLAALGVVGTFLQVSEFAGVSDGLPIPLVTFLVYTHPVWTLLIERVVFGRKIPRTDLFKLAVAAVALALLAQIGISDLDIALLKICAPLAAGFFIAAWITLSNKGRKSGLSSGTISLYYDLFATLCLLVIALNHDGSSTLLEAAAHLTDPVRLMQLSVFSILVGYVPNRLFYAGSIHISAFSAGIILLLEPITSSIASLYLWQDRLPGRFFVAAAMILAIQLPMDRLILRFVRSLKARRLQNAAALGLIWIFFAPQNAGSSQIPRRAIHLIEVSPPSGPLYTIREEKVLITAAFELAIEDYKARFPDCEFGTSVHVVTGTTRSMETLLGDGDITSAGNVLIGFSRTDFARTAAALTRNSGAIGISIGASAGRLREINPRFFSIVPEVRSQWTAIESGIKGHGCQPATTLGVFDSGSYISTQYKDFFAEGGLGRLIPLEQVNEERLADPCLFIGTNLSSALPILNKLLESRWRGLVIGAGDWVIHEREVKQLWKGADPTKKILAPTSWIPGGPPHEMRFKKRLLLKTGAPPSPLGAFTYDATIAGLHQLCAKNPGSLEPISGAPATLLLRKYQGIETSGNVRSPVALINPAERR